MHMHHEDRSSSNLLVAFLLNLGFALLEVAGGLYTNSVAILADAVHDAGDALSLGLAWFLERTSQRERDERFTYGYRRFSVLGGLISGVLLVVGVAVVLGHTIPRLWAPEEVKAPGMIVLALLGIAMNGAAYYRLHRGPSLTEEIVSWHLLEDILGWVAVLLGSVAMALWDVPILDPLLSIGISLVVIWNVVGKLRRVAMVFLQSAPEDFDLARFEAGLAAIPKFVSSHHTHVWTLDGRRHVLTTHLVLQGDATREDVIQAKAQAIDLLQTQAFVHATIAVELEGEACNGHVGQECAEDHHHAYEHG